MKRRTNISLALLICQTQIQIVEVVIVKDTGKTQPVRFLCIVERWGKKRTQLKGRKCVWIYEYVCVQCESFSQWCDQHGRSFNLNVVYFNNNFNSFGKLYFTENFPNEENCVYLLWMSKRYHSAQSTKVCTLGTIHLQNVQHFKTHSVEWSIS